MEEAQVRGDGVGGGDRVESEAWRRLELNMFGNDSGKKYKTKKSIRKTSQQRDNSGSFQNKLKTKE